MLIFSILGIAFIFLKIDGYFPCIEMWFAFVLLALDIIIPVYFYVLLYFIEK